MISDEWKSPIEVIFRQISNSFESQLEQKLMKVMVEYDLKVDIRELEKLLRGDREQYEAGFEAGYGDCLRYEREKIRHHEKAQAYVEKYKKWCKDCKWFEPKKPCVHFHEGEPDGRKESHDETD